MPAVKLHQIAFNYNPEEDRVLMRIKMSDMSEIRGWITRRFLSVLWPMLIKSMDKYIPEVQKKDPRTKEVMMGFQHQKQVANADFKQKFTEEVKATPLGEAPILFAKGTVKPSKGSHQLFGLYPNEGQGIELALDDSMLHSICKLLIDVNKVSGWALTLEVPGADDEASPPPSADRLN